MRSSHLVATIALLLTVSTCSPILAAKVGAGQLDQAARLIDESRPEEAMTMLDRWLEERPRDARALLLRSTCHFMIGNLDEGRRDLDRSIQIDPENRQAWLNRAALELADETYAKALESFRRAEALDRSAPENSLNIGAVLLLLNRFDEATSRFKDYLERNPRDPEARYLVSSNYAMRGFVQPAVANLKRAISLDEKVRRRTRTDPNFFPLADSQDFQQLLNTDAFVHPAGSSVIRRGFNRPYLAAQSEVLDAVIGSLQLAGRPFDPQVEVTPRWALIWSDFRIKVSDDGAGGTEVEISAPPRRFGDGQWRAITEDLLRRITVQLHTRNRRKAG